MEYIDLLNGYATKAADPCLSETRVDGINVQHIHPSNGIPVNLLMLAGQLGPPNNNLVVVQVQFKFEPAMYTILMSMFSPVHADGYYDVMLVLGNGASWRIYALPNWRQFPKVRCHIEHETVHEMGTLPESHIGTKDTTTCGWIIPNGIRFAE
jgi:hypothetical protein